MLRNKFGQSTAEYAILFGIVIAAIVAIQPYVKRTLQGRYKVEANKMTTAVKDKLPEMPPTPLVAPDTQLISERQFENNITISKSNTFVNVGTGTTVDVLKGGAETSVSINDTQNQAEDFRGNKYKDRKPDGS